MSKGVGELRNERVLWKLIYAMNNLEEIQNATWLGNAYITNTKKSFS